MIIKNRKILLTILDRGRLDIPVSNTSSKAIKSKVMSSPFEERILDKTGSPTGKYITPKKHFKAPGDFNERSVSICARKTTLSESCVNYFISSDACPFFIDKKKWEKMKDVERLEINLKLNAEGKDFSYEII